MACEGNSGVESVFQVKTCFNSRSIPENLLQGVGSTTAKPSLSITRQDSGFSQKRGKIVADDPEKSGF